MICKFWPAFKWGRASLGKFDAALQILIVTTASLASMSAFASSVTWEEQAERLQNVSATLLDSVPIAEPLWMRFSLETKTTVSFLPKLNTTVGGKHEKVPASPVHAVPVLQMNVTPFSENGTSAGFQLWAGCLPPGLERASGMKAKLEQRLAGGAFVTSIQTGWTDFYFSTGGQVSAAKLTGPITESSSNDTFHAQSTLFYFAPGMRFNDPSMFVNVLVGSKATTSEFRIPSDETTLTVEDSLTDSPVPYLFQGSIGWFSTSGFQIAFAQLWVPKRVLMPRVMLSYQLGVP